MRKDVLTYIRKEPRLQSFLHQQPEWYRTLTRNPQQIANMNISAMDFYGQTIPHKVEKWASAVEIAGLMLQMVQQMNKE